ncbi:MAG: cbb3-type cytochrome c oxidase subunit I [Sandaracinaceae bacterium]|nr:cbb3-type cytochrome c oxidase subunit I [Sandaracinaceae bacterium]
MSKTRRNLAQRLRDKRTWPALLAIVTVVCLGGLAYLGAATYGGAPPLADFVTADGRTVVSRDAIKRGQQVFHLRGLMSYGSFWGDGAERGPDFTADALHRTVVAMRTYHEEHAGSASADRGAVGARVVDEVRHNGWDETANHIVISDAQAYAFERLREHYTRMFGDPTYEEAFEPAGYIGDPADIDALTAFFFWGGWVCAATRPDTDYSYTHNWPFDADAGNQATAETMVWSIVSIFALFLGIMVVLYVYGQFKEEGDPFSSNGTSLTTDDLERGRVRATQRATYKFFLFAVLLFGAQVLAGILAANDFVRPMGLSLGSIIPFTVLRSYHTLFQIYWFFMAWVGYTIFFLPRLAPVPPGQLALINLLFAICIVTGAGALVGIYAAQTGMITGETAYWLGSQGWEFLELGRLFQYTLLGSFVLWIVIIARAVRPWLTARTFWSIPSWLLYGSGIMVAFLFFGLMISPAQNFAVSDYWRWMVVHMWVEVTFEVFTTVIVGYLFVQMGLISRAMCERVIFLAVMMFLATATLGVSHNFYWIAKPTGIIAIGGVFSTLQVLPLLLLTLDAWRTKREAQRAREHVAAGRQVHIMEGVWLFILGVNFWNIFGAGVFGSLINLPVVNYYEHATYLTGNHAHAAMFGVKGNIALGGMLFCARHLIAHEAWSEKLVRTAFWSLNGGVALMMFLDLFPAGLYQVGVVLENGLWYARTQDILTGPIWTTLTYGRSIGGTLFVLGGVLPLMWFFVSRTRRVRAETPGLEDANEWSTDRKAREVAPVAQPAEQRAD